MAEKQKRKNPSIALIKAVLSKYKCVCQFCGNDDINILELHHIDGNRDNTTIENLIPLCPNCHAKATKKIIPQHDVELMRQRVAVGTLPYPQEKLSKTEKVIPQTVLSNHGSISVVGDISNSRIETHVHFESKKNQPCIYPHSIGAHVNWKNYIDYLIDRLAEYRKKDVKYAEKNVYGAIRRIFKNKFGANVKDVSESKFEEIVTYFQREINNTKFARVMISKNHGRNFKTYHEFCDENGLIP